MTYSKVTFFSRKIEIVASFITFVTLILLAISNYRLISGSYERVRYMNHVIFQDAANILDEEVEEELAKLNGTNPLKILLWTTVNTPRWRFYADDESLQDCPVQCEFTEFKSQFYTADAIVFLSFGEKIDVPEGRKLNQIWVFHLMETPDWVQEMQNYLRGDDIIYNWTLTYRTDSDVPAVYGQFVKKPPQNDASIKSETQRIAKVIANKRSLLSWIVSRCVTWSKREEMVDRLKKTLPVDVYGQCGTLQCNIGRDEAGPKKSCYAQIGGDYKFYLALENSLCFDYVTEKFFLALRNDMVPIVYGGADYESFAPSNSFINARSFSSVQALGDYLKYLDQHPEEYSKYFEWRRSHDIQLYGNKWCALCKKLYSTSIVDQTTGLRVIDPNYFKSYSNVTDWWFSVPKHYPKDKLSRLIGYNLYNNSEGTTMSIKKSMTTAKNSQTSNNSTDTMETSEEEKINACSYPTDVIKYI